MLQLERWVKVEPLSGSKMYLFVFAARLAAVGIASLIATSFPAAVQDRNLARCLSIADVNERIDCLESGGITPTPNISPTPSVRAPKQPQAGPSQAGPNFDCRAANSSIERAICADATLSEWEFRMGQQYHQALRARKDGDIQSIMEGQRAWVQQRNSSCSGIADTAIWTCLLEMTKQRVAVLAKATEVPPAAQPPLPPQAGSKNQAGPVSSTPSITAATPSPPTISKPDPSPPLSSEGTNPLLLILIVLGAVAFAIAIFGNISSKRRRAAEDQRLEEERQQRLAEERQRLVMRYGEHEADLILARKVWQGMTDEQLIEISGYP